jgi:hypothetical protein
MYLSRYIHSHRCLFFRLNLALLGVQPKLSGLSLKKFLYYLVNSMALRSLPVLIYALPFLLAPSTSHIPRFVDPISICTSPSACEHDPR